MSSFIPCKPLNVILSKMSDFALRLDLKQTMLGLEDFFLGTDELRFGTRKTLITNPMK